MDDFEKPRLARLTAILTQLQAKGVVTAQELADRHAVTVRTIYRDIRTLEQSGVPIISETGRGYSLVEGYHLPPVLFTEDEANALVTAEKLVQKNRDSSFVDNYSTAVEKIRSVLRFPQKGKVHFLSDRIYFSGNNAHHRSSDLLMALQSAITDFELVEIEYHSVAGEQTTRQIEPFAFYSNNGNWLLIAFCRLRMEFRTFRLDNIQDMSFLDQTFPSHNMTLVEYFERFVKDRPPS